MSQEFDPYFKWLKIPPREQPPNHYRLLNTARFESDPDIIESAVARLVTLLQNVSTGDQAEHAQRILNDVAKARLCLSDPKLKAEYDEQLRKKLSGSTQKTPVRKTGRAGRPPKTGNPRGTTPKRTAPAGKVRSGPKTAGKKKGGPAARKKPSSNSKQRNVGSSAGLVIGYAVTILLVACVALFFLFQNFSTRESASNDVAIETSNEDWQDEPSLEAGSFDQGNLADREEIAAGNRVAAETPDPSGARDAIAPSPSDQPQPIMPTTAGNSLATSAPMKSPPPQPPTVSTASGQLQPDQLERFESKLGEVVEFSGVPFSAGQSSSGKTRYLRFSQDWDKSIMAFMLTREVGDDLTVAELQKFVGKTVRISGVVERQFGTNRLGVKIRAKDQLEIVE